ncbi:MAG: hypothetical protein ACR2LC_01925 [Pyrinomonadaceae bacterium]
MHAASASSSFIVKGLSNSARASMFGEGCVIVFDSQRSLCAWIIFAAVWQASTNLRGFYNSLETHVNAITRLYRNLHRKFE